MPIPYMGSKRKSSGKIASTIINLSPKDSDTLVDLFAGGMAISESFIQRGWSVIANDKNKYVIELAREAINGRFNDNNFTPDFITRQEFHKVISNPDNYDDWYVGYVQCIWSFGNSQKQYMFGKDVEPIKRAGHLLTVDNDPAELQKLLPEIPDKYIQAIMKLDNWHKRRLGLSRVAKKLKTRILELQQLQQLERLEQLEQLELDLYSGDYKNIQIPKNAVVYCDPPYQDTAEYAEGAFNHEEFWEYVRELSKTNKVFISEYHAPDDFTAVLKFAQKSTLQGGQQKHTNQPDECLFTWSGE